MPKYFHGWNIVAASIFGFSASPGQFAFAALGIFTIPLGIEFGWSREEISLAATIFTLTQAFATAIIGRVVDRIGAKEDLFKYLADVVDRADVPSSQSLHHQVADGGVA